MKDDDFVWVTGFFLRDKRNFAAYLDRMAAGKVQREPPLDENMRGLVEALNNLPFLYTMGSGGGELTCALYGVSVYVGSCWATCTVDGSELSGKFLSTLRELFEKFSYAYIKTMSQTSSYSFAIGCSLPGGRYPMNEEEAKKFYREKACFIQQVTELARCFTP